MTIVDDGIGPKPKDGKKPEAGAAKIIRPCSECGKKFWSWKALFGHMRCHPEREWRGINPPPNLRRQNDKQGWMTEEEHEVAECLLLLASGTHEEEGAGPSGSNTRFECSSCNRVFGSGQALGGHRASHKNVKGCFGITRSGGDWEENNIHEDDDDDEMVSGLGLGLGGHKCSICQRVFLSGQALGGHKRCHWEKGDNDPSSISTPPKPARGCGVDLNLPPPLPLPLPLQHHSPLTLDLRLGL